MNAVCRLLFFFLLSAPGSLLAQPLEIKGIIRDQNKVGIPYATVSIKNKAQGCVADEKGNYRLIVSSKDTLVISSPSYKSAMVSINNTLVLSPLFIYLTSKEFHTKPIDNTGIFLKPFTEGIHNQSSDATFTAAPGQSVVIKIENSIKKDALLSKIHARFDKKSLLQRKLRIRIFSVNPLNGEPFHDLLTENIIVTVISGQVSFDIEPYKIVILAEGCFVGFEWIEMPKAETKLSFSGPSSPQPTFVTPGLKTTSKVCNTKTYSRIFASEWRSWTAQSGHCPSNALIAATLKY